MSHASITLLAYPFRLFFPLAALFGALAVLAWLAALFGWLPFVPGLSLPLWHAHEMLYGFVPAAIAGFLLTAISNWTGTPPPRGAPLLILGLLWLAGRIAMLLAGTLAGWVVAVVDVAFLLVLALYATRVLVRAGNTRNLPIVAIVALLAVGNLLIHLALMGAGHQFARAGEWLALDTIALLIAVIGGRITPAFTRNWLQRHERDPDAVRVHPNLDRSALVATALMLPADLIAPATPVAALVALIAGALLGARLHGWRGWNAHGDPLLWILHLGYAWLALALLLKGLTPFVEAFDTSIWIHALGVGAMGTMIAGVMTRVAVAHTGRALALLRGGQAIYWLVIAAAILRLAANLGAGPWSLYLAGGAWSAAFLVFTARYGPILCRPRVDGQPG
jgi:uncharacterized protein involved in response to NO